MPKADDDGDNDFSLAIKNRASHPEAWHWEIHRLGRKSPIQQSEGVFKTLATATTAGNAAFRRLMKDVDS
jgi:hypothetical protein